jgi:MFS family permease
MRSYPILTVYIIAIALILATPFFVVFGGLSDLLGRKKIMMTGLAIAIVGYLPIYLLMAYAAGYDQGTHTPGVHGQQIPLLNLLVFIQVLFVTMVYGPIAAFLVEIFPTRVRYTSISLSYHLGNGVFGGLVSFFGTALVGMTGNLYAGLVYPISVALITLVTGSLYLKESHKHKLWEEIQNDERG